jgi:DNA-binding response OmpR family regulator
VVEDDQAIGQLIGRIARKTGLRVLVSESALEGLALAASEQIDLVIADVNMPNLTGPQFVEQLRARGVACPVLFISGDSSIETVDSSLRFEGASFLPKPFTVVELEQAIWGALRQR